MLDDLEFRRFIFRTALPIFSTILTNQVAEIFNALLGRGNLWSFATWCIGFSVTLGLAIRLYRSVTKAPTLSSNKFKGEKKTAKTDIEKIFYTALACYFLAYSLQSTWKKGKPPKTRKTVLRKETKEAKP